MLRGEGEDSQSRIGRWDAKLNKRIEASALSSILMGELGSSLEAQNQMKSNSQSRLNSPREEEKNGDKKMEADIELEFEDIEQNPYVADPNFLIVARDFRAVQHRMVEEPSRHLSELDHQTIDKFL